MILPGFFDCQWRYITTIKNNFSFEAKLCVSVMTKKGNPKFFLCKKKLRIKTVIQSLNVFHKSLSNNFFVCAIFHHYCPSVCWPIMPTATCGHCQRPIGTQKKSWDSALFHFRTLLISHVQYLLSRQHKHQLQHYMNTRLSTKFHEVGHPFQINCSRRSKTQSKNSSEHKRVHFVSSGRKQNGR